VTTTSVKLSPENASASKSVILGRSLGGRDVPVILVTQETFDAVYRLSDETTPTLERGKYVRLVNAEMITGLLNPVFVVVLTPVVVWFFGMLAMRGRQISTARKIFYGMVITTFSLLVMAFGAYLGQDGALKTSMMWLVVYYLIITIGELCLRRALSVANGPLAGDQAVAEAAGGSDDGWLVPVRLDRQQTLGLYQWARTVDHDVRCPGRGDPRGCGLHICPPAEAGRGDQAVWRVGELGIRN